MFLKKFDHVSDAPIRHHHLLAQDKSEWTAFLEFVQAYFINREILNPIIVEIGLMHNSQRKYYQHLMNAEHIGIDVNINCSPDILGDSQSDETMETLKGRLSGRKIDLLFIDGDHSYKAVKKDYSLFRPMVKHLIAFHDIRATNNSEVIKLWGEISKNKFNKHMSIEFNRYNDGANMAEGKFVDMGIGLLIKEEE